MRTITRMARTTAPDTCESTPVTSPSRQRARKTPRRLIYPRTLWRIAANSPQLCHFPRSPATLGYLEGELWRFAGNSVALLHQQKLYEGPSMRPDKVNPKMWGAAYQAQGIRVLALAS